MDEIKLSGSAGSLLRALHKSYKGKRKYGETVETARIFSGTDEIKRCLLPNQSASDIAYACWELDSAGFVTCIAGDDDIEIVILTADGISYAESRLAGILSLAWNLLKEMLPFIPFGA